ncbi:hypothetical protein FS749_001429 [Ceratobasidium sp. UAMH 11750]|nr:hypothetical protein FS749_001429 [Ceratobasidium sp. UAMH 11750]
MPAQLTRSHGLSFGAHVPARPRAGQRHYALCTRSSPRHRTLARLPARAWPPTFLGPLCHALALSPSPRKSPCSPTRLPLALLTPGADTPCLLARALDLGPPRLVPAPAVTHRCPVDRSCPNSVAHVHGPPPQSPHGCRRSRGRARRPPLPACNHTGPDPSSPVHNQLSPRDPLSSSPRLPSPSPASSSALASLPRVG